ncbi:hypothetical protein [Klebsiella aerogenes]|uniref:hypothetical protein n=1 Tax=Klebsiella aerogenes TaxID=548 RepID=UPI00158D5C8D|nr:hypothetical protein [Klebsiella aerogenes]
MKSSQSDRVSDEIIGEAVLSLLKTNRPINIPTLLVKLRLMQAAETNRQRRNAIIAVIDEISVRLTTRGNHASVIKKINGQWENRAVVVDSNVEPTGKKIH